MTPRQHRMYFREWSMARQALRKSGLSPKECDALRHQIHIEELGADKSHLKFTQDELDLVLAGFWKISQPSNLAAQLRQKRQANKRALWRIDQLLVALGKDRRFAEGVIEQIEQGIDPNSVDAFWQRERTRTARHRTLDQLTPPELGKVISALRSISKRRAMRAREPVVAGDPF